MSLGRRKRVEPVRASCSPFASSGPSADHSATVVAGWIGPAPAQRGRMSIESGRPLPSNASMSQTPPARRSAWASFVRSPSASMSSIAARSSRRGRRSTPQRPYTRQLIDSTRTPPAKAPPDAVHRHGFDTSRAHQGLSHRVPSPIPTLHSPVARYGVLVHDRRRHFRTGLDAGLDVVLCADLMV
jgi:hypothetical protein